MLFITYYSYSARLEFVSDQGAPARKEGAYNKYVTD